MQWRKAEAFPPRSAEVCRPWYNGSRQVGAGATAEIVGTHECSEYTDATCEVGPKCVICGAVNGEALGHTEANAEGKCDRCGTDLSVATADETIAITAASGTCADPSVSISWAGEKFTVTAYKGTNNNNIRTSDSDHFRVYQGNDLKIAGTGITKVVITAVNESYATVLAGSLTSAGATAVADGSNVVVTVTEGTLDEIAFTTTAQARINNIVVTCVAG